MENSSEYQIQIFISSTHYNLVDLRAELRRFLGELGYRPILSSSEGFPDRSPKFEPWESCLPVLDRCSLMILIIDGKYGTSLKWPNFEEMFNKEEISATHAEYRFAHQKKMRVLVFIRKELMTYYQVYRHVCDQYKSETRRKKTLIDILPANVDYKTLKLIEEVKRSQPIPWIKEFEDITQIKSEVQKKMINELAQVFLFKDKKIEALIEFFNKAMDELPPDKQKEFMKKVNATKEMIEENEELKKLNDELRIAKKEKESEKIKKLEKEIEKLNDDILNKSISNSPLFLDNKGVVRISGTSIGSSIAYGNLTTQHPNLYLSPTAKCDKCGKDVKDSLVFPSLNKCPSCSRELCNECWPAADKFISLNCPECRNRVATKN